MYFQLKFQLKLYLKKGIDASMREKRYMTEQEKYLRHLMQKNQVSQVEIAEYEGISEQAVNQQLLRLTPSKLKHLEAIIIKLSKQ